MRKLTLFVVLSPLALALSCSSESRPGSTSIIPPVMAQTGYSTASLSGTYSLVWTNTGSQESGNLNGFYSGVGTMQLNGSGNVTSATLTLYNEGVAAPCVYTATGTYSLQSTALGSATLNLSSSTKGCTTTATWQIALAAANSGSVIQMSRSDGSVSSGTASKQ